jgi:hypothetical protein
MKKAKKNIKSEQRLPFLEQKLKEANEILKSVHLPKELENNYS